MRKLSAVGALFGLSFAGSAHALCSMVSSDRGAVVRPLNPAVHADANLILSMTMMPKIMHVDYDGAARRDGCRVGPLAGDNGYELWADDWGQRHRKAVSRKGGLPVAIIVPVADILTAVTAQKPTHSISVQGYLLATISKTDFAGWRYYTGMPDLGTLKRDMEDVLAGKGNPIFRQDPRGQTILVVPKS